MERYTLSSDKSILDSEVIPLNQMNNKTLTRARISIYKNKTKLKNNLGNESGSISNLGPILNSAAIISNYLKNGFIKYIGNAYVVKINNEKNQIFYFKNKKFRKLSFTKLFICCGCINSLYLAESLRKRNIQKTYKLNIAPSIIFPVFSIKNFFKKRSIKTVHIMFQTTLLKLRKLKGFKIQFFVKLVILITKYY